MKPPNLEKMAEAYTMENYLELSWDINYPKVLGAMQIAAEAQQRYNNEKLEDTLRKTVEMREKGDRPK